MSSSNQDDEDEDEENKKDSGLEEVNEHQRQITGEAEELFKDLEQNSNAFFKEIQANISQ